MNSDSAQTSGAPAPNPVSAQNPNGEVDGTASTHRFGKWVPTAIALMRSKGVRLAFLAVVVALLVAALIDQAGTLWTEIQRLSAPILLAAFGAGFCGLVCSFMVWRTLLADLGSPLSLPEAWRINFIGQLGKYVPGSIWPVLAQTELGADRGIPRTRSAVSVMLSYAVATATGAVVAAVTLPFAAAGAFDHYFWVLFAVPVSLVLLSPPVLNRLLERMLRLLRITSLEKGVSFGGLSLTVLWVMGQWLFNGTMTYILLRELAGPSRASFLVSVGAYALSWVVGFVAVFAPAGAGVREAVMVAVLSTKTTTAIALTVALVTRALAVVCDAATGAMAAALVGRRRLQRLRLERSLDPVRPNDL